MDTVTITRSFDAFVESSLRSSTSASAEFEAFHALAAQLDNVVADPDTGMHSSLQRFFDAVQDVADTPASPAARQVLFNESQVLATQFNELASWIDGVRGQVNSDINSSVNEINQLSQAIADLNQSIVIEQGRAGHPPNDLQCQNQVDGQNSVERESETRLCTTANEQ